MPTTTRIDPSTAARRLPRPKQYATRRSLAEVVTEALRNREPNAQLCSPTVGRNTSDGCERLAHPSVKTPPVESPPGTGSTNKRKRRVRRANPLKEPVQKATNKRKRKSRGVKRSNSNRNQNSIRPAKRKRTEASGGSPRALMILPPEPKKSIGTDDVLWIGKQDYKNGPSENFGEIFNRDRVEPANAYIDEWVEDCEIVGVL